MKFNIFFSLIIVIIIHSNASATLRRVNNNPGITLPAFGYSTFAAAHTAAVAGDTLYIEPSNIAYTMPVGGITKRLTLIGPGYFLDQNTGTPADKRNAIFESIILASGSSQSVIEGLVVSNVLGYSSISTSGTTSISIVTIKRCLFASLSISSGALAAGWIVKQCLITSDLLTSSNGGIEILSNNIILGKINTSIGTSIVKNNLIYNVPNVASGSNVYNNIFINDNLSTTINSIHYYNNVCVNCPGTPTNNNFYTTSYNTMFQVTEPKNFDDLRDARFQLPVSSPAKSKGVAGIDCGPFAGPDPYILSGIPAVPNITAFSVGAPVGGNIPVTFSAKRNN